MTPAVSPAKFRAKPGVERPKTRTIGLSSCPPFCRLARVTRKSAVLETATAAKRTRFLLSKNLCGTSARGLAMTNAGAAATDGFGVPGSGPCANAAEPRVRRLKNALIRRTVERRSEVISARRKAKHSFEAQLGSQPGGVERCAICSE